MSHDFTWLEEKIVRRRLDEDERQALSRLLEAETIAKGEHIVSQGMAGGVLYLLRSGSADIERQTAGGSRSRIATARAGALLGEMTFLTGEAASADVIAREKCEVYKLTQAGFSELMRHQQGLVYSLFAYMLLYTADVIRHMNEEHIAMLQYISGRRI